VPLAPGARLRTVTPSPPLRSPVAAPSVVVWSMKLVNIAPPTWRQFAQSWASRAGAIATVVGIDSTRLSVSPDERWLLYTLAEPRGSNVMLAENFE
jgi:hypothetical protein